MDDSGLVRDLATGDPDAFERFVEAYQQLVFRTAARILQDENEADCVVQDTFVRAHTGLTTFRGESTIATWLARIATNLCLDRLRKRSRLKYFHQWRQRDGSPDRWAQKLPAAGASPEEAAADAEARRIVHAAVQSLTPQQQIAFTLRYLHQQSVSEIAAAMGIGEGTVKSHLFRATQRVIAICRGGKDRTP